MAPLNNHHHAEGRHSSAFYQVLEMVRGFVEIDLSQGNDMEKRSGITFLRNKNQEGYWLLFGFTEAEAIEQNEGEGNKEDITSFVSFPNGAGREIATFEELFGLAETLAEVKREAYRNNYENGLEELLIKIFEAGIVEGKRLNEK